MLKMVVLNKKLSSFSYDFIIFLNNYWIVIKKLYEVLYIIDYFFKGWFL